MGANQFAESLVELMLSWVKLVANWFWGVTKLDVSSGIIKWITNSWLVIAVLLIIGGAVADWLVWMIRWRPYWLWFRKKQLMYDDEEKRAVVPPETPKFYSAREGAKPEYEDPFAELPESAEEEFQDDPLSEPKREVYKPPVKLARSAIAERAPVRAQSGAKEIDDLPLDGELEDPYAKAYDRERYARPTLGGQETFKREARVRPVLTGRSRHFDVGERK